jgi:hypothetical protein
MFQDHDRKKPQTDSESKAEAINWLVFLLNGLKLALTVFSRRSFGRDGIGFPGLFAICFFLVYASYAQSAIVLNAFYVWLFALLIQRLRTSMQRKKGIMVHSRYDGFPWLGALLCRRRSELSAYRCELGFWVAMAVVAACFDPALGGFIGIAACGLVGHESFKVEMRRKQQHNMEDARIELAHRASQFNNTADY